jgi:glycosyltransferase involved in cell wall biosynthesis
MPIVMMEALSAGASVIATRVSGIEDYENHPLAKNCLWVNEIGNVEEAVSNIEIGMKIPREIRQKNARSFAESEFDLKVCLDRYFDAINSKISSLDKPVLQVEFNTIHLIKSHMISLIRFMKIKFIHRLKSN